MAIDFINSVEIPGGSGGGTSDPIDTTGANLLVISGAWFTSDDPPTDSFGNTWKEALSESNAGFGLGVYYSLNPTVGADHTFTLTSEFSCGSVQAFSGVGSIGGSSATNASSASSIQPGSITPSPSGALFIAAISENAAPTDDSVAVDSDFILTDQQPFTSGQFFGSAMAYLIQGSAAAENPTFSWTGSAVAVNAAMIVFLPPLQVSIVQVGEVVNGAGGDFDFTLDNPITEGNKLLLCVAWDGNDSATTPSATDTLGNEYDSIAVFLQKIPPNASITSLVAILADITTGGSLAGTCAMSGARGGGMVLEISGLTDDPLDQTETVGGTTSSLTTPGAVTTTATQLLLAIGATLGASASTLKAGPGFAIQNQGAVDPAGQMGVEAQIVVAEGTYTAEMDGLASGGFNSLMLITLKGPVTFSISGNCGWPNAKVVYQKTGF